MRDRLALLLPLAVLLGCSGGADAAPDGPQGTRSFPVAGFRAVSLRGSDDVVVRVGPAFAVRATGPQPVLDNLVAEVRGDTLRIGRRNGWRWDGRGHARVEVTLPAIVAASVAGSGDMVVGPFRAAAFDGSIAGSGDLTVERAEVERITLSVAGSGDLKAAGRAATAKLSIAGSGDLDAAGLTTTTLSASTAGSGDITARATGSANASVVGSGDIEIHGTDRCITSKVGSGAVTCTRG